MLLGARCGSRRELLCDFWIGRVTRCQRAHHFRQRNERVAAFQVGTLAIELSGESRYPPAGADVRDAAAVRAIDLHGFNGERIAGVAPAMALAVGADHVLRVACQAVGLDAVLGCGTDRQCVRKDGAATVAVAAVEGFALAVRAEDRAVRGGEAAAARAVVGSHGA